MKKLFVLGVVILFTLSACSSLLGGKAEPTQDIKAALEQTLAVQNAIGTIIAQTQAVVTEDPALVPTIQEPTATTAPTETPVPSVKALANTNANCRSGPAANFDYLGVFSQGATADVIGKNTDFGKWWKIKLGDGTECWVTEDAITLTGETGSVMAFESPKTPTPKPPPDWNGTWTLYMSGGTYKPGSDVNTFTTTMTQSGNKLTFSYRGWGSTFYFSGTVSPDGMSVSGSEWGDNGYSGAAYLVRNPSNLNQFRGKWYVGGDPQNDGSYCGSKNGAGMPSPCRP
jgi:uncharacterized protein YgiM (DUF1202 family)